MNQSDNSGNVYATAWLTSGQELRIEQIALYQRNAVAEIMNLRANAAKALGPAAVGSGLGIWGTPGFEFAAGAAALGLLTSLIANASQKAALEYLGEAERKIAEVLKAPIFVDVNDIDQISTPLPQYWHAVSGEVERGDYLTFADTRHLVHSTNEFVTCISAGRRIVFRWNQIVSWRAPEPVG